MGSKNEQFQKFLDSQQYNRKGIVLYEKIFGKTYVSTGGQQTTTNFCSRLNLKPGQKVLDIGCGIGGSAFYLAREYGVDVYGVDLSTNMVGIANSYRDEMEPRVQHRVQFHVSDAVHMDYPENFYDVVYSRDTILHIGDKLSLFKNFYKCLKPGGLVLISDYCQGDKDDYSKEFKDYVKQRGYHLLTVPQYGKTLENAGFINVDAIDNTEYFIEILNSEMELFSGIKSEVIGEYSPEDYDKIISGWEDKVVRCGHGDQVWGYFFGKKPFA